jgi:hypothetical protein
LISARHEEKRSASLALVAKISGILGKEGDASGTGHVGRFFQRTHAVTITAANRAIAGAGAFLKFARSACR